MAARKTTPYMLRIRVRCTCVYLWSMHENMLVPPRDKNLTFEFKGEVICQMSTFVIPAQEE
jgi:hypothetical protein